MLRLNLGQQVFDLLALRADLRQLFRRRLKSGAAAPSLLRPCQRQHPCGSECIPGPSLHRHVPLSAESIPNSDRIRSSSMKSPVRAIPVLVLFAAFLLVLLFGYPRKHRLELPVIGSTTVHHAALYDVSPRLSSLHPAERPSEP